MSAALERLRPRLRAIGERLAAPIVDTTPAQTEAAPELVLVACSDQKADTGDEPAPASQVYTSPLFRLSLEYARTLVPDDRIRIVSAKHHILGVDEPIKSYDLPLGSLSKREREAWGGRVVHMLLGEIGAGPHTIVLLAGADYVLAIQSGAVGLGWTFRMPFGNRRGERMAIGQRLQWLQREIDRSGSRLRPQSDEELARIVSFLRERAAEETARDPNHHRPAPDQTEIAALLEEAAAFIQRRRLDVHAAIRHLRELAVNDRTLAASRLYLVAKGLAHGKHRRHQPAPRRRQEQTR